MRIVVFSDSHKNFGILHSIVLAQPDAQLFLHLGDGEREFEELSLLFPDRDMRGVPGNCDWGSENKPVETLTLGGKKIFMTHGHIFGVKSGFEELIHTARAARADIALFGHTHVAYTDYTDGLYMMNPGSVTAPNAGPPSYGIIDITGAGVFLSIVDLHKGKR